MIVNRGVCGGYSRVLAFFRRSPSFSAEDDGGK